MRCIDLKNMRRFYRLMISLSFFSILCCPLPARASSDDVLLNRGIEAYNRDDYVAAVMYLFAYQQNDPALLKQNPAFSQELNTVINYCADKLRSKDQEIERLKNQLARQNQGNIGSSVSGLTYKPRLVRPLAAPRQVSPSNGQIFNHYPRKTVLRWQPVGGAESYTVEIDCFQCCQAGKWCSDVGGKTSIVSNLTTPRYTFNFVGAQPGRWRVYAVGKNNQKSPVTPWWEFRYTR